MLPNTGDIIPLLVAIFLPFLVVFALMPRYISYLRGKGRLTNDAHKGPEVRVPTPAGPLLMAAVVLGELGVWAYYGSILPLVVVGSVLIAGLIGLYDDLKGLGGVVKPALLVLSGGVVVLAHFLYPGVYDARLYFPLFTYTGTHYIIFALIVLASVPVASNAFNMLDAFNGEISGFTAIVSASLVLAIILRAVEDPSTTPTTIAIAIPLLSVSLAFYYFNRYPSRIFDGDSGSLMFGAMYVVLSIVGGVEIAALVALIPAVLNSYYILSSVRGLVERKQMTTRPTHVGQDGRLYAATEEAAPTTLARMVLLGGPLGEKELVNQILLICGFAAVLSVVTSAMTWLL